MEREQGYFFGAIVFAITFLAISASVGFYEHRMEPVILALLSSGAAYLEGQFRMASMSSLGGFFSLIALIAGIAAGGVAALILIL